MTMTDADQLEAVKKSLGITGSYQDDTIKLYISDVKEFLADAGVQSAILSDSVSVGVISRGVADLWNYGNGKTEFSEYFRQRAKQLTLKTIEGSE